MLGRYRYCRTYNHAEQQSMKQASQEHAKQIKNGETAGFNIGNILSVPASPAWQYLRPRLELPIFTWHSGRMPNTAQQEPTYSYFTCQKRVINWRHHIPAWKYKQIIFLSSSWLLSRYIIGQCRLFCHECRKIFNKSHRYAMLSRERKNHDFFIVISKRLAIPRQHTDEGNAICKLLAPKKQICRWAVPKEECSRRVQFIV